MANEYLKRTPTSSGNQKVWTWAGWVKISDPTADSGLFGSYFAGGSRYTYFRLNSSFLTFFGGNYTIGSSTTYNSWIDVIEKNRDAGGWMHIMVVYHTTNSSENERVKIYINGVNLDLTRNTSPTINSSTYINAKHPQYLGAWYSGSQFTEGELSDVFLVDGQALTPDVFGFYKDGDGYVSAGSTQATDFRPGQWMPHAPRVIKKSIERSGGFGVNGYYLPLNDSSNPGADFHCDPNSIIKLKGEDLPQPQNGAPATSDAFVSQLRQETGTLGFDGVVKFDGTGDYLSLPKASFQMLHKLTSSWTIEGYIFKTADSQGTIFDTGGSSSATIGAAVYINSGGDFRLRVRQATGATVVSENLPGSVALNRWQHIALSYDGTSIRIFVEGILLKTVSYNTQSSTDSTQDFSIGVYDAGGAGFAGYFTGFISNLRVIDGTALYTANFTAPTEPLTNVTNTTLLCCNSTKAPESATVAPTIGTYVQNWTENTSSDLDSYNGIGAIYDGQLGTSNRGGNSSSHDGSYETLFDGQSVAVSSTIEIYWNGVGSGQRVIRVNGTTEINGGSGALTPGWDSHSFSGTVTKLEVKTANTGSYGIAAVRIDSNILTTPLTSNGDVFATRNELTGSLILACPFVSGGFGQNGAVSSTIPGLGDYHIVLGGSSSVPAVNFLAGSKTQATISGSNGLYYGSSLDVTSSSFSPRATVGTAFTLDGDYTVEFWCYINSFNAGGSHVIQYDQDNGATGWLISFDSGTFRWMLRNSSNQDVQVQVSNAVEAEQWNHIAGVYDSSRNLMTGYLNGVAVGTTPIAANYISTQYTSLNRIHIGSNAGNGSRPMQGYLQDLRIYKGLAKYKGGFDVPKPYTPVGIEAFRITADTCKNNFATLNPLVGTGIAAGDNAAVLKDGNLYYDNSNQSWTTSTHGVSSGKYYAEFMLTGGTVGSNLGVCGDNSHGRNNQQYHADRGISYIRLNSTSVTKDYNATSTTETAGDAPLSYESGSIVGITIDYDNKEIKYYKNGTLIRTDSTPASYTPVDFAFYFLAFRTNDGASPVGSAWADVIANFGQNPSFSGTTTAGTNADDSGKGLFKYAPPTGFLALCEDNLPTPAIADPGKHFKSVLYHGDGNNGHSITGVGFQPDLVWLKERGPGSSSHQWHDSVRGAGKALISNVINPENYSATYLYSLDSDGFTLGTSGGINASTDDYVAWCWKAGGVAVSNSDGSITSQVSANQDAGFSIVSYTTNQTPGATVGHGLGKTPKMIIVKQRTGNSNNWPVYHTGTGNTKALYLDLSLGQGGDFTGAWNNTSPTSSVFSLGNSVETNRSGSPYIAYCWTEIEGYSKFGSYVGNNSTDGPFVYCGFKPAWVMYKRTDTNGNWAICDSSRNSTNPLTLRLFADQNWAEASGVDPFDFVSNGFKFRTDAASANGNGATYIFAAFAESPFQTANAK